MNEATIKALIVGVFGIACFAGGWVVEGWRKNAEILNIKNQQAEAISEAVRQNNALLVKASQHGDKISVQLAETQNALTAFAEEKNREISKLSTGRRCLDNDLVRVLNTQPSSVQQPGVIPKAASLPLRPFAAATLSENDGEYATDEDVAWWIGVAGNAYEICRGRLNAIAEFYRVSEARPE